MKALFFSLALLTATSASAVVTAIPSEKLFNEVAEQSRNFDFHSYSQIICMDGRNNVVAAGATHWPMGTEIFLVEGRSKLTPLVRVSGRDEMTTHVFKKGAVDVTLTLGKQLGLGIVAQKGTLTIDKTALAVTCFSRISGLE